MFVTLTYDDEHVPRLRGVKTIDKSDLQKFIKRLRKSLESAKIEIKYYGIGEYGRPPRRLFNGTMSQGYRPHYHIIIFGLDSSVPEERDYIFSNWPFCKWTDERKQESIGFVSTDSIRYTTDYIKIKPLGKHMRFEDIKFYLERAFPFSVMSKGMGLDYVKSDDYLENQIKESCELPFRGKIVSVPRYYCKKLEPTFASRLRRGSQARAAHLEKLGIDPLYDLYHDCFGRVRHPKYVDECEQHERNLDAKAALYSRQCRM